MSTEIKTTAISVDSSIEIARLVMVIKELQSVIDVNNDSINENQKLISRQQTH